MGASERRVLKEPIACMDCAPGVWMRHRCIDGATPIFFEREYKRKLPVLWRTSRSLLIAALSPLCESHLAKDQLNSIEPFYLDAYAALIYPELLSTSRSGRPKAR
jgi:hypothetical protein